MKIRRALWSLLVMLPLVTQCAGCGGDRDELPTAPVEAPKKKPDSGGVAY